MFYSLSTGGCFLRLCWEAELLTADEIILSYFFYNIGRRWVSSLRTARASHHAGQKKIAFSPDSTIVSWPDDKPIRLQISYDEKDLHGDRLVPAIALELQQFNEEIAQPYLRLDWQSENFTWNYVINSDTIEINTVALIQHNPIVKTGYAYFWQFRARLENPGLLGKVSEWIYASPIRLVPANRVRGVPKNPTGIKLIF